MLQEDESKKKCKYCDKLYKKQSLSPVLITPTFLKDIKILPLQMIWSNAFIELTEASNVVFVGYSLRPEDYYFRFLLSKAIRQGTNIYIIDPSTQVNDKYHNFFQKCKITSVNSEWQDELNVLKEYAKGNF